MRNPDPGPPPPPPSPSPLWTREPSSPQALHPRKKQLCIQAQASEPSLLLLLSKPSAPKIVFCHHNCSAQNPPTESFEFTQIHKKETPRNYQNRDHICRSNKNWTMDPGREGSDKLMQKDTVLLALLLSSLPQLSSGKQESLAQHFPSSPSSSSLWYDDVR